MQRTGLMKFYKRKGAAQFKVLPPVYKVVASSDGPREVLDKEGAILLEVAPGVGDQKWDWSDQSKISFAISFNDICQLLETNFSVGRRNKATRIRGAGEPSVSIFHKYKDTSKILRIVPGQDDYIHTWKLYVKEGSGKSIMVSLSDGEHNMLMRVLTTTAPQLIGFV